METDDKRSQDTASGVRFWALVKENEEFLDLALWDPATQPLRACGDYEAKPKERVNANVRGLPPVE